MLAIDYLLGTSRSFLTDLVTSFNSEFAQNISLRGNRIIFPHTAGNGDIEFHELEDGISLLLINISFTEDVKFICDPEESGYYALYFFAGTQTVLVKDDKGATLTVGNAWGNGVLFSAASCASEIFIPAGKHFKTAIILVHKRWLLQLFKSKNWIAEVLSAKGSRQFTEALNIAMLLSVEDMFNRASWSYTADVYLHGSVRKLLSQFYDAVMAKTRNGRARRDMLPFEEVSTAISIKSKMENNLSFAQLTLEQIAGTSGMNKVKINSLFRILYGDQVNAIAHKIRMQAAVEMLLRGHSILEVGRKVGYGNTSHFARTFFNTFKITPKKYQKSARPHKEKMQKHVMGVEINY